MGDIGPGWTAGLLLSCRKLGQGGRSTPAGLHRSLLLQSWVGLRDGAASVREHVLLAREEEVSSLLLLLEKRVKMIMTPWEDLFFVINNLLLGEEPVSKQTSLLSSRTRKPASESILTEAVQINSYNSIWGCLKYNSSKDTFLTILREQNKMFNQ